jgi:hypothetical protein
VIQRCLREHRNLIGEPTVVMFRRGQATRGFDPSYRQLVDLEMWFHLLESGNLVYTPRPLCAFRRHPQQQTEANNLTQLGQRENLLLMAKYSTRSWLDQRALRREVARHIYDIHKGHRDDLCLMANAQECLRRLGRQWYLVFWLHRRLTQPFVNLNHSVRKRWQPGPRPIRDGYRRLDSTTNLPPSSTA